MKWVSIMMLSVLLPACSQGPETAVPETAMPVQAEGEGRMKVDATHNRSLFYSYYSEAETEQLITQGARVYQVSDISTMFELPDHMVSEADASLTAQVKNNPDIEDASRTARVWVVAEKVSAEPATITVNIDGYRLLADVTGFTPGTGPATYDLLVWGGYVWQFDGNVFEKIMVMDSEDTGE
jgi:hypothetical protein